MSSISPIQKLFLTTIFLPLACLAEGQSLLSKFIPLAQIEKDIKIFCLNKQISPSPVRINVFEATSRNSKGFQFESFHFEARKNGIASQPDCVGNRDLVFLLGKKGPSQIVFDSNFFAEPYCDEPVRQLQAATVYELQSLETKKTSSPWPIAVMELTSSTLPCPDSEDLKSRRYQLFNLNGAAKLILDIQADFVVPEIGDQPYRLHFTNVTKVWHNTLDGILNQKPLSLEIRNGKLKMTFTEWKNESADKIQKISQTKTTKKPINSIYAKDDKHVYIETTDKSGIIEGADPSTFQILSKDGDSAYTKDVNSVYFYGEKIARADAKTFIQLNDRYGKDLKHVFHMQAIIEKCDLASFIAPYSNVWYAKDKSTVYSGANPISNADPETFSVGEDRSCGSNCTYRSEDKQYRFDTKDQIIQTVIPFKN